MLRHPGTHTKTLTFVLVELTQDDFAEHFPEAEHGEGDDGADDDGHFHDVPDVFQVRPFLVLDLHRLLHDEVDEDDDVDHLSRYNGAPDSTNAAVHLRYHSLNIINSCKTCRYYQNIIFFLQIFSKEHQLFS